LREKKLTVGQVVKKFPAFYGVRKFIVVFTKSATDRCLEPDE